MWKVYFSILFLHFSLSVQLIRSWGHHLGVMPVSIIQWHVEIGIFHTRFSGVSKSRSALLLCNYCTIAFYFVCCKALTLFICGDVDLNPGPKNTKSLYYFSLCHWNLNSLLAHGFSKLSLIEAYNTHHNFDMICLSETYLNSSYADNDTWLNLKDFTLIGADNPHNCNRGGISIYFKEHLAVCPVSPLDLNECLVLEINIQNKKGYAISLYRSPSQSKDEFCQFLLNFEQLVWEQLVWDFKKTNT